MGSPKELNAEGSIHRFSTKFLVFDTRFLVFEYKVHHFYIKTHVSQLDNPVQNVNNQVLPPQIIDCKIQPKSRENQENTKRKSMNDDG